MWKSGERIEMLKIKGHYVVTKRNVLNEIRANTMSLQELRFFSIYLSKINPSDVRTRAVRFPIEDFKVIMDLGRVNIEHMKAVTNSLLGKVVNIPNDSGGYTGFQLFKQCVVDADDDGEWYVEIDAHDKALPLMFEFKDRYFSYRLWNALRLKSANQLRMYEILKQYERIGERVIPLVELKNLLGLEPTEYPRYGDFRRWVLDSCQAALTENTDITFTYEPYGKKGRGGKIMQLKFTIKKNEGFIDPISLVEFIQHNKTSKKQN
jgi:plasmid replication initiation protein